MTNKELEIPSTELPDNVQEDIILRSPTVILDGKIMIENNAFNQEMGFKKL